MLEILCLPLGMVETNTYIVADPNSGEAVVIDPAWDGEVIARRILENNWVVRQVWHTHAHFDHIGGTLALVNALTPPPVCALHSLDLTLWNNQGGASLFGMAIKTPAAPEIRLENTKDLVVGAFDFEVRHAPGHTPGHVVFYCKEAGVVFCGDVIFAGSIGRTDLPGGDFHQLIQSIRTQLFTLPDNTRLLSGHGPETTVGFEKRNNPFLNEQR